MDGQLGIAERLHGLAGPAQRTERHHQRHGEEHRDEREAEGEAGAEGHAAKRAREIRGGRSEPFGDRRANDRIRFVPVSCHAPAGSREKDARATPDATAHPATR
jgi:hypothetical protein